MIVLITTAYRAALRPWFLPGAKRRCGVEVKAEPGTDRMMAEQDSRPPLQPPDLRQTPEQDELHRNKMLDEALQETFPASDPPAMLEPKCKWDR